MAEVAPSPTVFIVGILYFLVCAGIGAWNYPIQGAGWKSAPALASRP